MYNYSPTVWSIWPALSILNRLFVVILVAVSIYSLITAIVVMKELRAIAKRCKSTGAPDPLRPDFRPLHARCTNLRQILGATFYLFGFLFFIGLQNAFITVGDGPQLPFVEVLNNFVVHFVLAANVFLAFLILHLAQWLVSNRVETRSRRFGG